MFSNQLAEAGISAKRYIAEGLGYGTGDEGIAKMTEDLEDGAIASNKALEALLGGMMEYKGMMDRTANETVSGLWSQIEDTFEINIFRRWGQGLQEGAKEGFGALVKMLDTADDGLERLGDMLYETGKKLSNWGAGKLDKLVSRITALAETDEFQNAGLGGKFKIMWDGLVADPLKEWWEGGGQKKTAETAGKIGEWMGKTISDGLLALLGVTDVFTDSGIGESGGMSVAQSFVKGFTDNFDGSAIKDAFVDAISDVWGALPTWAKVLLGGYAGVKGGIGLGNLIGGIGNIAGAAKSIGSGAATIWGSTGNAMVQGTGVANLLASLGYKMAGGASVATIGGGTAALLGGATVLGAGAGLASGISGGIDLYKGYKGKKEATDRTSRNIAQAQFESGGFKLAGVASGAAVGAALGSVIPIIGTGVGAALGAGIGGIAGWVEGNRRMKKAQEEAEELAKCYKTVEEAQEKAGEAAATAAAKLIEKNRKLAQESLAEHFGDVTLNAEEMQKAIRNIIGEQFFAETAAATEAIDTMNMSLQAFENQNTNLKKSLWMSSMKKDAKLTSDEVSEVRQSVNSFSSSAQTYVSDAQFAAAESIRSIMGNSEQAEKLIESTNKYYDSQSDKLAALSKKLSNKLSEALSDNVITIKEKESIDKIRSQMANIIRKLKEGEYEAEINILKAKYAGDLSAEGFGELMTGAAEQNKVLAESYWDEFGVASVGKSEKEIEILRKGVLDKLSNLWSNTGDLGVGTLRDQYSEELGILGQDLSTMLEKNTPKEIMNAVDSMSDKTRQGISQLVEYMKPTTEQIQGLVDSYKKAGLEPPKALTEYLQSAEFYESLAKGPEAIEKYFNEQKIDIDPKYKVISPDISKITNKTEIDKVFSIEANVKANWHYDEFDEEWISPDGQYSFSTMALLHAGWTYNEFDKTWISPDGSYSFHTNGEVGVDYLVEKFPGYKSQFGIKESYNATTVLNLKVKTKITGGVTDLGNPKMSYASKQMMLREYRGGIVGPNGPQGFAAGGMVRGGGQIIKVAEEGTPEMIIPLGSQRRERALKLWAKAGEMMNVPGFARGGLTRGKDEGLRFSRYGSNLEAGSGSVQVDVGGVQVEINVDATGSENIVEAIRAQAGDIAETVAGIMADALEAQFENIPTRGGVA